MTDVILTPDEVRHLSGGYTQPASQLKALHRLGYWRAHRSKVTGAVVVERAHQDAVARGESQPAKARLRPTPSLRPA
jgi:hypothetical protein